MNAHKRSAFLNVLGVEFVEFGLKEPLVRHLCVVFRNERWGEATVQCEFNNFIVLAGAKKHADSRVFVRLAYVPIKGLKVKVEFAQMLGLELSNLQFDCHKAVEAAMKEE